MASLTETAYQTKHFFVYLGIFILAVIILKMSWDLAVSAIPKKPAPPPPPPTPTESFGKIPALVLPQGTIPSSGFTYQLDTLSGSLPAFSPVAKVFPIQKPQVTFLSQDRAKELARKLGFETEPRQISQEEYTWQDATLPRSLKMNFITENFAIRYDLQKDASPIADKKLIDPREAIGVAQVFLQGNSLLQKDLSEPKVTFLKWEDGVLKETLGSQDASVAKIDFPRKNIEDILIVAKNFKEPQISILVTTNLDQKKKIVAVNYTYWPINIESASTYSLKTPQAAFEELKQGKALVASSAAASGAISIRDVTLAYFEPEDLQDYLQPVYEFLGDNEFVAYVPAIGPGETK